MSFAQTFTGSQSTIKPFYHDEYAKLELDDSGPCVRLTLNGVPRCSDHFKMVLHKLLELIHREIKNYPKLHMLADSRKAGLVLDEDVDFFKTQVLPEIEKTRVRFFAIVMPTNKFAQLAIRDMTHDARVITARYFDSMREARAWLRKITLA